MNKFIALSLLVFSLITTSCGGEKEQLGTEESQIENYIKAKHLTISDSTEDGLKFILTKANPLGTVLQSGQTVSVNYTGKFIAGKKMDKEFDSGSFSFSLNGGEVVKGFDKGISKMKVGEKAVIIFPSAMGYGSSGAGSIPEDTPLLFEIEVVSVK